jgi:uncharacterized protein YcfL
MKKVLIIIFILIVIIQFGCSSVRIHTNSNEQEGNNLIITEPTKDKSVVYYKTALQDIVEQIHDSEIKTIIEEVRVDEMRIEVLDVKNHDASVKLINEEILLYENRNFGNIDNDAIYVQNERKYVRYKDYQFRFFGLGQMIINSTTVIIELNDDEQIKVPYHIYVYDREQELGAISSYLVGFTEWNKKYYEYGH